MLGAILGLAIALTPTVRHLGHPPRAAVRMTAATDPSDAVALPTVRRPRLFRRVGAAIASPVRGMWVRCDEQLCRIDGPPNPFRLLSKLVPKKRALNRLQMCEEGTVKVKTTQGVRDFVMVPAAEDKDTCSVDAALDML